MKMTKELKKILLKGFNEMLDKIWICESWAQKSADTGNEEDSEHWREERRTYQDSILKAIEDLIEVEGE